MNLDTELMNAQSHLGATIANVTVTRLMCVESKPTSRRYIPTSYRAAKHNSLYKTVIVGGHELQAFIDGGRQSLKTAGEVILGTQNNKECEE